jgi:hypothetical protein
MTTRHDNPWDERFSLHPLEGEEVLRELLGDDCSRMVRECR